MQNYGLVSIITPSYNCADYISETIESIQSQTYGNWELLITDDCSTDNSREVIERYALSDPRIKLMKLPENSGAGVARNNSIREAKGRFIAFCDSDDRWYPAKLERQLSFMVKNGHAFTYTSYMTCEENGEISGIVVCRRRETLSSMMRDDKIGCLTAIYDIEKVGKVYMPDLRKRQDWALKLKVLSICGEAHGIKEPLALYRLRSNSLSQNKRALVKYNIAVYNKVLNWNIFKSYAFFIFVFMPSYVMKKFYIKLLNR